MLNLDFCWDDAEECCDGTDTLDIDVSCTLYRSSIEYMYNWELQYSTDHYLQLQWMTVVWDSDS